MTRIVWFRNDLRLADNPALHAACQGESPVLAVFLVCAAQWDAHDVGERRLAFLKQTLRVLHADLAAINVPLLVARADTFRAVPDLLMTIARGAGADAIYANAEYPLNEARRDRQTARACEANGIRWECFHGGVLLQPGAVLTGAGEPYSVFTPFKKRLLGLLTPDDATPLPAPGPRRQHAALSEKEVASSAASVDMLPDAPEDPNWRAGEAAARTRLDEFLAGTVARYEEDRNFPILDGTSRLSAHLSIGSLSARSALAAAKEANGGVLNATPGGHPGIDTWISELIWREFYRHVIALYPHVSRGESFRREMDSLPWRHDPEALDAWKRGRTGYPIVDAGMRQLEATGFMHNRLRMITAMFLTKHLLIDWREGERHFMRSLRDGDFAANNGGWQWSAATGTDAAPYFRIFNPTSQAARFDPDGRFVRHFVPEYAGEQGSKQGGKRKESTGSGDLFPGSADRGYPEPIVEHRMARERALAFFKAGRTR